MKLGMNWLQALGNFLGRLLGGQKPVDAAKGTAGDVVKATVESMTGEQRTRLLGNVGDLLTNWDVQSQKKTLQGLDALEISVSVLPVTAGRQKLLESIDTIKGIIRTDPITAKAMIRSLQADLEVKAI